MFLLMVYSASNCYHNIKTLNFSYGRDRVRDNRQRKFANLIMNLMNLYEKLIWLNQRSGKIQIKKFGVFE